MGGNATLQYGTKRIDKQTYEKVCQFFEQLFTELTQQHQDEKFAIPLSYLNKESHGDIDLLTTMFIPQLMSKLVKHPDVIIHEDFLKTRLDQHGNYHVNLAMANLPVKIKTKDFETEYFQLDLISTEKKYFDSTYHYYCFNDLGNLLGRTAYALGLRFGQDGLYYRFPYENKFHEYLGKDARLNITNDYFKALELLGFGKIDKETFYSQFKEKEDVFNFIMNGKNFTPYAFLNTFKNSKAKMRDSKRKVLNDFVANLVNSNLITEYEAYDATEEELPFKREDGLKTLRRFTKEFDFKPEESYLSQLKKLSIKLHKKILHKKYNEKMNGEMILKMLNEFYPIQYEELLKNKKEMGKAIEAIKGEVLEEFEKNKWSKTEIVNKADEEIQQIVKEKIDHFVLEKELTSSMELSSSKLKKSELKI